MQRRNFLKWSTCMTGAMLFALGGCTQSAPSVTPTVAPLAPTQPDGLLRVAFPGIPKQLDPALYSVIEEHQIGFAIFDGLVWVDQTLTPQPMLAETWEEAADALSWTFKLRRDVKFHHGTPFTAQDVVYTFERILNPHVGSPFGATLGFIEGLEVVNDYTVRFHLRTPSAEMPLLLGAPPARIVAHDSKKSVLSTTPSGTGPFLFAEQIVGKRIRLVRNPEYWDTGRPSLAEIEYHFMPMTDQVSALRNGTIDLIAQISPEDAATFTNDPNVAILETASGAYQTIVMRATEKPFDDLRVRQALKYCIDRNATKKTLLGNRGSLGNDHPIMQVSPFWADLPLYEYNPEKAKQLLAQAGYSTGLKLDLITSTVRPGMVELAQAYKEMAKPAGIDIQVVRVPAEVYWSDYAGKVPFHTGNWGFRPSIDETFMAAYHSRSQSNESNWRNPALDTLIDSARGESDSAQRKQLYQQAQKLLMEEGAVIIPYFKPTLMARRDRVQGFIPHPAGWVDLRTTYLGDERHVGED